MATAPSLRAEAGRQLKDLFGFEVDISSQDRKGSRRREFNLEGNPRLRRDVDEVTVRGDVPLTKFTGKGWSVELTAVNDTDSFDLIAEKRIGAGRLVVISPFEYFSKRNRKKRRCKLCITDLTTNIFEWISER